MSDLSDVPAVVVERAPDGWTHIGGPGMHLLIGLDEEDDCTIAASDAADGGDLDDVLEVLTAGGMRKAHHFVGVHWQPRTRVVAFGPVSALVTLGDGSAHDVRATSNRVWTDLELPEHPERVVLRVLEESERSQRQPSQPLASGPSAGPDAASGAPDVAVPAVGAPAAETAAPATLSAATASPERPAEAPEPPTDAPERSVAASATSTVTPTVTPTVTEPSKSSPWDRSWATPGAADAPPAPAAPAVPRHVVEEPLSPAPAPAAPPASGTLRPWTSVRPSTPSRTDEAAQAADDLPPAAPADLDSTWSARPVLEPAAAPSRAPRDTDPSPTGDGAAPPVALDGTTGEEPEPATPSYDYLFGHTTAADEHRRVLAALTHSDDDEEPADDEVLSLPSVADTDEVAVTNPAPEPEVPAPPVPTVQALPAATEGGLISSVPWASRAPAPEVPKSEPTAPTFSGRHTPPPPPNLLPPMNTPPPGVRAPEATPLISTGPPPVPPATTVAPGTPTGGPASHAVSQPSPEPTFEVPIAPRPATAPAAPTPHIDVADEDAELTVDRSALLEARKAAQGQGVSGPSVLAVLCPAGHPTPPHGDRCRVCGAGIPPQGPFTMPRPPLGVLRLSTGDVVTLDRSVLLGRAPKLGQGVAAHDRPHVVKVPSPERDISRNHVEVILEGWHVLIRDLGTTNGTTVTLPGEGPVRLRANDQQVLEPGSFVSMADEVSFTFETGI